MNSDTTSPASFDISKLTLGCWGLISDQHWGERDVKLSKAVIESALDLGVTLFDTAHMYGNGSSETLLGEVLGARRPRVLIATKMHFSEMSKSQIIEACEGSLRRLGTDYIDLYQIHWPSQEVPLEESWSAMEALKSSGKVREIGVCNCGQNQLEQIVGASPPLTNQLPYNVLTRAIEYDIIPACQKHSIGILAYSPLLHGVLSSRFDTLDQIPDSRARTRHFGPNRSQIRHTEPGCEKELASAIHELRMLATDWDCSLSDLALRWTISQPQVISVIAGASHPDQLSANFAALDQPFADDELNQINQITEEIRTHLGRNADLWQSGANARIH